MRGSTLALVLLFSGCLHATDVYTRDFENTPTPQNDVYLYFAGDTIPQTCVSVAEMRKSRSSDRAMIDFLREEAGILGANAVQVRSLESAGSVEVFFWALFTFGLIDSGDVDSDALALRCPPT